MECYSIVLLCNKTRFRVHPDQQKNMLCICVYNMPVGTCMCTYVCVLCAFYMYYTVSLPLDPSQLDFVTTLIDIIRIWLLNIFQKQDSLLFLKIWQIFSKTRFTFILDLIHLSFSNAELIIII